MGEEELESFFINQKPVKILVNINNEFTDNYASELSSEVDATYSHTVRILHKLEDYNLVESKKDGRKKVVELTDEGKDLAEVFGEVVDTL